MRRGKKRAASSQQHKNAIMNELLHPQMLAYVCKQVTALFHSFVANDMITKSAYHVNVTCTNVPNGIHNHNFSIANRCDA